jgi:hypothetical protein
MDRGVGWGELANPNTRQVPVEEMLGFVPHPNRRKGY